VQIIFLSRTATILLCFVVWPALQVAAAIICLKLPDRKLSPNAFIFRAHPFEKDGHLYEKAFHISRWKHLLPDGGMIWNKKGFKKKRLDSFSEESLNRFLIESVRGELTHWLAILPFWVFGLFAPIRVVGYMLIYALLINVPCILAQRYNRPRVQRLLGRKLKQIYR